MSNPAISCIIPVYNGIRDLRRAVSSALSQGPEVEVVLVDDCSEDGSKELILQMARDDPRIIALPLPANRGQATARNLGVAVASASYVTFLDQDDEHAPGWYGHALDLLDRNNWLAAVKGDMELADLPADLHLEHGDVRWRAMMSSVVWNVVMRKIAYGILGGFPTSAAYRTREGQEDRALIEALFKSFRVATTSFVAARHHVGTTGATAYFLRRTRVVEDRFEFLEATAVENSGDVAMATSDYLARAAASVESIRRMLQPPATSVRMHIAKMSARLLQKLQRPGH